MLRSQLALVLLAPAALAGQIKVVGNAPGQFPVLQDALSAAQDGDIVLVKTNGPFGAIRTDSKSVAIVNGTSSPILVNGAARVANVGASDAVVLIGLNVTGSGSTALPELASGLNVNACAGSVIAQDCRFQGWIETSGGWPPCTPVVRDGVEIRASTAVTLTRCVSIGAVAQFVNEYATFRQGSGLSAQNGSRVAVDLSQATGGSGGFTCQFPYWGVKGGNGAWLNGALVYARGSTFQGGNGGPFYDSPQYESWPGDGGAGVQGSTAGPNLVTALGGGFVGGLSGPTNWAWGYDYHGYGGPAIAAPVSTLTGTVRSLTGPGLLRDNQAAELQVTGAPGDLVELAISRTPAFVQDPTTQLVLQVSAPVWVPMGTVAPNATSVKRRYRMPNLHVADPGRVYYAQARVTSPSGAQTLTNLQAIVLVDATY